MLRSISTVMSGTVVAQVLALLLLPVISRTFAPKTFGEYQVLASAVLMLLPLAGLKMEFAILRLRSTGELPSLLTLCVLLNFATALLLMLTLWVGVPLLAPASAGALWAGWMLPASFLAAGLYQTFVYLPVRDKRYFMMSASKVAQTGLFHGGAAASGWLVTAPSAIWLVVWDVVSRVIGSAMIVSDLLAHQKDKMRRASLARMGRMFRAYRRYPLYSLPGSFIGALVSSAPVFLLSSSHGVEAAGQFGMAWRTAFMPVAMLIYAVSQVVSADISQRVRSGGEGARATVIKVARHSALIGIAPLLLVYAYAEPLTPWILGAQWAEAGRMIAAMTPLLLGAIVTGPINMVLVIMGRPGLQFGWEVARAIVVLGTLWGSASAGLSAVDSVGAFSLAMLAMALLFVALAVWPSRRPLQAAAKLPAGL
jgi:O-antigen/teichoic acid export membrane protein